MQKQWVSDKDALSTARSLVQPGTRSRYAATPWSADLLSGMTSHRPAQAPHGVGEWLFRTCRPRTRACAAPGGRWARAVATFGVFEDVSPHGDVHQPGNAMLGQDGCRRWGRRRFVRHAWFALLACIQRVDLGHGTGDALAVLLLSSRQTPPSNHQGGSPMLIYLIVWVSGKTNRHRIVRRIDPPSAFRRQMPHG